MLAQRREADLRGAKRQSQLEQLVGLAQHRHSGGADLGPDTVALHDDEMDHDCIPLRTSAVRWPAAIMRKPMSVCVVTKRTPLRMKACWRARSRSPPSPAYLPWAPAAAITRSMATTTCGSPNAPGLPMAVRRSLQPTC